MKNYLLLLTLFVIMFSLGSLCYFYLIPKYILSSIFLLTYVIIVIKFLSPKELRMNKLKFLSIPTILLIVCSILFFKGILLFTSLIGAYVVSVGVKNWIKFKLIKDNI